MTVQELIVAQTKQAADAIVRNFNAIPEEKRDWRPMDAGRSALDLLQECATLAGYATKTIRDKKSPEFDEAKYAEWNEMRKSLTAEQAEAKLSESSEELYSAILDIPDSDLDAPISLPFGEGMIWPLADVASMHRWNMNYHLGQLAYIQTLLGDREMH
jgi:hypothetical protein